MLQSKVEITNPKGIHARPSTMLVQAAKDYTAKITLEKSGQKADAGKIMEILMLAAMYGDELTVTTDGPDEAGAMETIIGIFASRFDEG